MRRLSVLLLIAGAFLGGWSAPRADAASPAPRLFFSDLESGPKSGNSDTSLGQTAGQDGVIVSVWGAFLGQAQGDSKVLVNGAEARVYYWGDAVSPYSPANLSNGIQRMQLVIFQVSQRARDGRGEITVTVQGTRSNPLPFTVRAGRIFFVTATGRDGAGGAWRSPWRTIQYGKDQLAPGDTLYVGNGVKQPSSQEGAALMVRRSGSPGSPMAVVAYPGAQVTIGSPAADAINGYISDREGPAIHWTFAKLTLVGQVTTVNMRTGFRLVGSNVSAPNASAADGTVATGGGGSDIAILGNEFAHCGNDKSISLYHVVYISADRTDSGARLPAVTNREIGWNYFHDNLANRAINIYSQGTRSSFLDGNSVHDNLIVNQRGDGILLGWYTTGETWVYNNVVINAGLGPAFVDGPGSAYTCLDIRAGHDERGQGGTRLHIHHNTFSGCGWAQSDVPNETGAIAFVASQNYTLDVHANIIHSTTPYVIPEVYTNRKDVPRRDPAAFSHNLWFGAGPEPGFDSNSVNADPQFVNPKAGDLRLGPSSPAIGRGAPVAEGSRLTHDFDGRPRPSTQPADLGAFQRAP